MSDEFATDVKRRFDETFGLERLPLFMELISSLEADGQHAAAKALKVLLEKHQVPE